MWGKPDDEKNWRLIPAMLTPALFLFIPAVSPKHPKGAQARILLSSVFGPSAQDD
jgi:hypothetical protein